MFSTKEFIEASRKFVCIRIETYENKESEQLVKKVLHGRLANTSFVILNPQGTQKLTRSGRSPGMAMIRGRSRTDTSGAQNGQIVAQMNQIARQYRPTGNLSGAVLQDFNSLRQALNCASADQRLLVFVNVPHSDRADVEQIIQAVFADKDVIGKFHLDFTDYPTDRGWTKVIHGAEAKPSIMVIRPSQFGLDGRVGAQLALSANLETIRSSLLKSNEYFAKVEKRKDYEEHVQAGKRQRIFFENEISRRGSEDTGGKAARRPRRRPR